MLNFIVHIFSFEFFTKALLVGVLVSLCSALLGTSLVLKRYSMIGDGLSHIAFGSLAIAMALNIAPLHLSIPVVIVTAIMLLRINRNSKIKGDALIALISSSSLAIGYIVLSISEIKVDISRYMFGSITTLQNSDVVLSIICSILVLSIFIFSYNKIFSVTFDENFSKATGIKAERYNLLIALLTAVIIVIGMRLMGALLISSIIIFPSLSSMRIFKSYKAVTTCSSIISVLCFLAGLIIPFILPVPIGATVVVVNLITFIIFTIIGKAKNTCFKLS